MEQQPQENFLEQYVLGLLKENGFDSLSEENQKKFLPQFVAEAERRIGIALLPQLDEQTAQQFADMTKQQASPDEWWKFWSEKVPGFLDLVKKTLEDYAQELKGVLSEVV